MLSEKIIPWSALFIFVYAILVAGFYLTGIINIRASEILCAVPCLVVAIWYLIAYYEEQGTGREGGILISSSGWAFVGLAFLCPAQYWNVRLISGIVGVVGILIGCVIGLRMLTSQSKASPPTMESEQHADAEEKRESISSKVSTEEDATHR